MKDIRAIKLVIFDMDGLIFDTERLSYECWKIAADKLNVKFDLEVLYKLLGTNHESVRKSLIKEYGEDFAVDDLINIRNSEYMKSIGNDNVDKKPGLIELLDYIGTIGIKKAVATSSSRETAYRLLKEQNIFNYFDYILCGDEVSKSKPDPEVFLNVAKKLDIDPANCIVLEDSEAGTLAAYRAGMKAIVIPDMKMPNEETVKIAYKVVNSLKDVIKVL